MYQQFRIKAEAVGAELHRFATAPEALGFLIPFLKREQVADASGSYALWADSPFLRGVDRSALGPVPGLGFEVTRERAAQAKIGISQAQWALADTGTLVQDQSAVEQRLVSSLPAIHVALIATDRILADKRELLPKLDPRNSRYIAFITGPSRTADIERVLTIGVHGPKRLVILCIDEPGGER